MMKKTEDNLKELNDEEVKIFIPLFARFLRNEFDACFADRILLIESTSRLRNFLINKGEVIAEELGVEISEDEKEELEERIDDLEEEIKELRSNPLIEAAESADMPILKLPTTLHDTMKFEEIMKIWNNITIFDMQDMCEYIKSKKHIPA